MPTIPELDREIEHLTVRLAALNSQRTRQQDALDTAVSQRPVGIPVSWKPYYLVTEQFVRIYAWYDPAQFGDFPFPNVESRARIP